MEARLMHDCVLPSWAEEVVPNRYFVICSSALKDSQTIWLLAGDNRYAHVASDIKNLLYCRSAGWECVCISIGLAHAVCVFCWF